MKERACFPSSSPSRSAPWGSWAITCSSSPAPHKNPFHSRWFYVGFAVYASTALGWVFVMRHLKLATIGVVYSISMILLLTTIGVAVFREPLNSYEVIGLVLALVSLVLLVRFA